MNDPLIPLSKRRGGPLPKVLREELKPKILAMSARGKSIRTIAGDLGLNKNTVMKLLNEACVEFSARIVHVIESTENNPARLRCRPTAFAPATHV